jgi:hypothetical protein
MTHFYFIFICDKCDIYYKCDTHDMCHTVTQCDTPGQKYDNWGIKLDIVTLTLCETVTPKVFNLLDPQITAYFFYSHFILWNNPALTNL